MKNKSRSQRCFGFLSILFFLLFPQSQAFPGVIWGGGWGVDYYVGDFLNGNPVSDFFGFDPPGQARSYGSPLDYIPFNNSTPGDSFTDQTFSGYKTYNFHVAPAIPPPPLPGYHWVFTTIDMAVIGIIGYGAVTNNDAQISIKGVSIYTFSQTGELGTKDFGPQMDITILVGGAYGQVVGFPITFYAGTGSGLLALDNFDINVSGSFYYSNVAEPTTMILVGAGLLSMALLRRKFKK